MADFVLGVNNSTAKKQFEINPRLQRTKASGNRRGFTLGTEIFDYPINQNGQVVLRNRSVPLQQDFVKRRKVPRNIINPLQVPTEKSKGNFEA